MKPRVGQSLASTTDSTTVIVVRWSGEDLEITCGGAEMVDPRGTSAGTTNSPDPAASTGTVMGKRYADDDRGIELLVTKAGSGTLAVGGVALLQKDAKQLPASD